MTFSLINGAGKWFDGTDVTRLKVRAKRFATRADSEHARLLFVDSDDTWQVFEHPKCCVEGCTRDVYTGGMCQLHYRRQRIKIDADMTAPPRPHTTNIEDKEAVESARREATRVSLQDDLRRARACYNAVAGAAGRLKWQKTIRELEKRLREDE